MTPNTPKQPAETEEESIKQPITFSVPSSGVGIIATARQHRRRNLLVGVVVGLFVAVTLSVVVINTAFRGIDNEGVGTPLIDKIKNISAPHKDPSDTNKTESSGSATTSVNNNEPAVPASDQKKPTETKKTTPTGGSTANSGNVSIIPPLPTTPPVITPPAPSGRTIYVSTNGNDSNSGLSLALALRSPAKAVEMAMAGDTVRFEAGVYVRPTGDKAALNIINKEGQAGKPITFTTVIGQEKQAVFVSTDTNTQSAIVVQNSSYIVVQNLDAHTADSIFQVLSSQHIVVRDNYIHRAGQLGIAVRAPVVFAGDGSCTLSGGFSSNVVVEANKVYDTGHKGNNFAEGIYLGQGCANGADQSHDIAVRNNEIYQTKSEAIEVKIGIYNTVISGNYVHDINVASFGAITVNAARSGAPLTHMPNGNFVIENNTIDNVTSRQSHGAGIWIAHGSGVVRNNIVRNIANYHAIVLSADFGNPAAKYVEVAFNSIVNYAMQAIAQVDGIPGGEVGDYNIHDNAF